MENYKGCREITSISELQALENASTHVIQSKSDGMWVQINITKNRGCVFTSRNGNVTPTPLDNYLFTDSMVLIGEYGYGTEDAVTRRMVYGHDFVDVFDIVELNGIDLRSESLTNRRATLERLYDNWDQEKFRLINQRFDRFVDFYQSEKEGVVVKKKLGSYPNTNTSWIKLKHNTTIDMVVLGRKISESNRYSGLNIVASITCGQYVNGVLKPLVKVSNMPELWRAAFADSHIGDVVELKCLQQFKSGSLRSPSFIRLRPDKNPTDCVFDPVPVVPVVPVAPPAPPAPPAPSPPSPPSVAPAKNWPVLGGLCVVFGLAVFVPEFVFISLVIMVMLLLKLVDVLPDHK